MLGDQRLQRLLAGRMTLRWACATCKTTSGDIGNTARPDIEKDKYCGICDMVQLHRAVESPIIK